MRQARSGEWLEKLKIPQRLDSFSPLAIRFLLSIRLIAVHQRAKRDPVPELAAKLGNFASAIHALEMAETLGAVWPDPVRVSGACCHCLTHDEVTLGRALEAAANRNRKAFDDQFEGLLKPGRIDALWEQALSLIAAEFNALPRAQT